MSNLGQVKGFVNSLFGNDYLRDYRHASKTFVANNYAFTPKYKFLFHTYFNINSNAWQAGTRQNFGILVKDIKLPSYNFSTVQLNQYNRKRIIQTKIKYDPVSITFHDDNSNSINKLWYAYYTYYYNDANKPNVQFTSKNSNPIPNNGINNSQQVTGADYNLNNIYKDSITGNTDWGYYGESANPNSDGQKIPFFQNITVFGFNQHNFTAYTLINPIITSFGHDTYNYEEGNGVMKNTMTIDYETVVYNEGAIDGRTPDNIVTGFGDRANYDRRTSPNMNPGANGNIFGPLGLVDGQGGTVNGLASDLLSATIAGSRLYDSFKSINNFVSNEEVALQNMEQQALQGFGSPIARNRNILFDVPNKSVTPYTIGVAGAPTIVPPETYNVTNIPNKEPTQNAGVQVTTSTQVTGINNLPYGR